MTTAEFVFTALGLLVLFLIVSAWDAEHVCPNRFCPHKRKGETPRE